MLQANSHGLNSAAESIKKKLQIRLEILLSKIYFKLGWYLKWKFQKLSLLQQLFSFNGELLIMNMMYSNNKQ